jgi:hypothetical protein
MRVFNRKKEEQVLKTLAIPVIKIGSPNSVGNVYTLNSVKDIFENFDEKKERIYGSLMKNDDGIAAKTLALKDVTHYIDALVLEDDFVVAITKFMNTSQAKIAREMLDNGLAMLRPTINGFVDQETKEIIVYDLLSFDILPFNDNVHCTIEWIGIR